MGQNEKDLLIQPPQKVLQMYQAVMDMLNEKIDINSIKVSDITTRAGIGKGTAYEYFSTKEEIITKALIFEITKVVRQLEEIADSNNGFEWKVKEVMHLISQNFHENRTFWQLAKIGLGSYDVSDALKQEYTQCMEQNKCNLFEKIVDRIMTAGLKEQVIQEKNEFKRRITFNSQTILYSMYLVAYYNNANTNLTEEEAIEFAYQNMVKILN